MKLEQKTRTEEEEKEKQEKTGKAAKSFHDSFMIQTLHMQHVLLCEQTVMFLFRQQICFLSHQIS